MKPSMIAAKKNTLLATLIVKNELVIACNPAFTTLSGFTESEMKSISWENELIILDDLNAKITNLKQLFLNAQNIEDGIIVTAEMRTREHYSISLKLHCIYQGDNIYCLYFQSPQNKSIDPVSGLPNGYALHSRIQYMSNTRKVSFKNMVLIMLSVDNFSTINYRYNYPLGDKYLLKLGQVLKNTVLDFGFAIRFANATYGILIENKDALSNKEWANYIHATCENICKVIAEPIHICSEINITKSFSLGVSALNVEYDDYHAMQIAAETAMCEAQKNSGSKYIIAPSQPAMTLLHRKLIIDELPYAIEECKIKVHYQPQYNLNTRQLIGFEALSRWKHESIGDIPPDVFVAIAEEIGLHFEFDLCVFEQVCVQIMLWRKQNIAVARIAINISFKTMEMSNFIERLQFIIKKTHCPISLIELEVTETSSINNIKILSANIAKVKELGIMISVDDFGTGYSSLSLILAFHLSFDKLKLDRSFIDKICHTTLDKDFAEHIISLGKMLNVSVLAEGVETQQQCDLLMELGFDYGQGYYFSKVLTANEAGKLMSKENVIKQIHPAHKKQNECSLLS